MQDKLKNCCAIRSGQTFKKSLDQYRRGDLAVVLPKNIVDEKIVNPRRIDRNEVRSLDKHLLRDGEMLIVNKGAKFNSFIYRGDPAAAVATTAFYVITPGEEILPGYLHWYLGQREARDYLLANARGSTIPLITIDVLEELPVPLIPVIEQKHICEFVREMQTEQALLKELISKREAYAESYIWEHIQQSHGA
jgi:restriction endonuclease S subunit